MSDKEFSGQADELSAEDLDMAVGGRGIKADVKVQSKEEHVKRAGKTEEAEKFVAAPTEEKMKHE